MATLPPRDPMQVARILLGLEEPPTDGLTPDEVALQQRAVERLRPIALEALAAIGKPLGNRAERRATRKGRP